MALYNFVSIHCCCCCYAARDQTFKTETKDRAQILETEIATEIKTSILASRPAKAELLTLKPSRTFGVYDLREQWNRGRMRTRSRTVAIVSAVWSAAS